MKTGKFSSAKTGKISSALTEAKLAYLGHVLMENRNGLAVDVEVTLADGRAERRAALLMAGRIPGSQRCTLGADKGYDAHSFAEELRDLNITPHIASKKNSKSVDGRTTRHEGYAVSQRKRKRVEEIGSSTNYVDKRPKSPAII